MDIHIFIINVEFLTASSEVAIFEEVEVQLARVVRDVHEAEHPNVELPPLEQQWLLNILLNNPLRVSWLLFKEVGYISYFGEHLDAAPLVQGRWLQNPEVLLAVLLGAVLRYRETLSHVQV